MTSFAVVSLVRRVTGIRKVGHAGTLDPIADGVLPICLGRATRLVEHVVSQPKAYRALVRLGVETDTYDSEGTVVATGDPSGVSREAIETLLPEFTGQIEQLPPMYSALKFQGRPLYHYARAGKDVPREPRAVRVYTLALTRFEPPLLELEMEVGRGAYVRTIAHDLGRRLGCGAHLEGLTRTRSGPFELANSVPPDELRPDTWQRRLLPPDRVLESWYAALLAEEHALDVLQGRSLALEARSGLAELEPETPCRAYSHEGDFLGVLRYRGSGVWKPERVFESQ